MSDGGRAPHGWDAYLERFHADRPGITEAILAAALDDHGTTAYEWVGRGLAGASVVDVGCGSGPNRPGIANWVGIDRSSAELDRAAGLGRVPVVAASAGALPLRDRSVDVAIAAMSLMVIDDPAAALVEIARVVRPGGAIRVLVPTDAPLTAGDRVRYAMLLGSLGRAALSFPHPEAARHPQELLARAGFEVTDDQRRRFGYPIGDRARADLFLESLYLPGIGSRRMRLARAIVRSWRRAEIGIPLRSIEATLAT